MTSLESIVWCGDHLKIIDQLLLPTETQYLTIKSVQEGWKAINKMQVRGAPAIAIVGCLSLAADLLQHSSSYSNCQQLHDAVSSKLLHLVTARPTAVNMQAAAVQLTQHSQQLLQQNYSSLEDMMKSVVQWSTDMLAADVATNKRLGDYGCRVILDAAGESSNAGDGVTLITICNTGSLATAGYGTALGVVRSLHAARRLGGLLMLETRPYLQGARLTAVEAVVEQWPNAKLVCDGAVCAALSSHSVHAAVVGADRVAANGDTANKIGTHQLAVLCEAFKVPFYVCTPFSSIDLSLATGAAIPIEHRPAEEMACVAGKRMAPHGVECWNPAFDVTPARLITGGIVTEFGVFTPEQLKQAVLQHTADATTGPGTRA